MIPKIHLNFYDHKKLSREAININRNLFTCKTYVERNQQNEWQRRQVKLYELFTLSGNAICYQFTCLDMSGRKNCTTTASAWEISAAKNYIKNETFRLSTQYVWLNIQSYSNEIESLKNASTNYTMIKVNGTMIDWIIKWIPKFTYEFELISNAVRYCLPSPLFKKLFSF